MQFKTTVAILTAIAATVVNAKPIAKRQITTFDVWAPKIISPDANTVWAAGSTVQVTWDTSDAPVLVSNQAAISLNKNDRIASEGWLKDFGTFDLRDGSVEVTVPSVAAGDDYSITLFGDSGNSSPHFKITA